MILSAVILTKNEEASIGACINSLRFCDEIVVIDDFSFDKTEVIAKELGAKVYKRALDSDFSKQRNFGLSKANGKWVMFVDADERASKQLANEIVQIVNNPILNYAGLYLKRTDYFAGKKIKYGEFGTVKLLRIAKKGVGKWRRRVHEKWNITGKTKVLKNPLDHYPHQSLREFIAHVNFYSSLHAKANFEEKKRSSLFKILFWPWFKFINNYVVKKGFLDKNHGLVIALAMSFHSFLAWSKLWLIQKKK